MTLFAGQTFPLAGLKTAFDGLPPGLRGSLWMLLSGAAITGVAVLIRFISGEMHPLEIVFFRNLFGLAFLLPWAFRTRGAALATKRFPLHGLRAALGLMAMACWFTALSLMPVADATAITFTAPLFGVLGAALVLGEQVGPRRWSAVAIGFLGMLIILRPDESLISTSALIALGGAFFMAGAKLCVKALSRTEKPDTIVLWMGLLMTPASLIPAAFFWTWPTWSTLALLVVLGLLASIGQRSMARAFASADASAVMPLDFSRLLFAALFGWLVFSEWPDLWTWVGAAVIFSATVYTARREALARRQATKETGRAKTGLDKGEQGT